MQLAFDVIEFALRNVPGAVGRRLRGVYYRRRLGACGTNVVIDIGVIIQNPESVFLGNNIWIDNYVQITAGGVASNNVHHRPNAQYPFLPGELHVSDNVHVAPFAVLQCHGGVAIGSDTGIAAGAKVFSLSHHYRNPVDRNDARSYKFSPMSDSSEQYFVSGPVVVGDGCAVGLNSVILPGATIPSGTWVGVNATISRGALQPDAVYASADTPLLKSK
jgi:acetyltransferase-like isoleucine patch superfamily enzyme